jgi:opacity protein-like surface antigen
MLRIIQIIFVILPLCLSAQVDSSKYFIGGTLGIGYSSRILTTTESELELIEKSYNELEEPTVSFRTGLRGGIKIGENSIVSAGLLFSQNGYRIDTLEIASIHNVSFRYKSLEIPLMYQYTFIKNKSIKPYLSAGVAGSFIINSSMHYMRINELEKYKENASDGVNKLQFGALVGAGISKRFYENYTFLIESLYHHNFTSIHDGLLERKLTNVSVNFGIVYHL